MEISSYEVGLKNKFWIASNAYGLLPLCFGEFAQTLEVHDK